MRPLPESAKPDHLSGELMEKRVTVLCGVSGSGKTHQRTHMPGWKNLLYVDIADVYKEFPEFDSFVATVVVCKRALALLQQTDHVVVEGYFLPDTPSRRQLEREMTVAGVSAKFILLTVTTAAAQQRILDQYMRGETTWADADLRIRLLLKVQPV